MASKHDIGWEHAEPVDGSRRTTKCKYCEKVIHGGITRLKQHIAHIFGQVEGWSRVPVEVSRVKKVGKTISKFFLFNAIPFNATDSGPYYQSMIDTIAEVGPNIKGPTGYQIGNTYLEEEVSMIYHSSVDTINIPKTVDYIFSLMDKVVKEVGEENVVQVVTDNEASFKAVVNLMKVFTKDRDLLRPRIIRFSIEFISLESLIRYEADLNRMCTTNEWREFNKDRSRKSLRDKQWIELNWLSRHRSSNEKSIGKSLIEGGNVNRTDICMMQVKLFVDGEGEFGSALIKKAINQSLPSLPINEEGRETVHEDDGAINRRVSRHTSNATQERYVDSSCKGKTPRTISSSSSSDNGDNGGSRRGGGTSGGSRGVNGTGEGIGGDGSTRGGYVSQVDPDMSWAQGGENYYATQDTNHGYRPEIWEQRKHLERLTTFPSDDD
uniref:BED-type domain-containing protein n=1 Tax=Vitis vinifera TaxID=29760 RepID=A5BTI0_VITVI|nr:hypothetical protein VITISV_032497 [Vitis vinifera]